MIITKEVCRKCGCTNNNPCYHPKYGFCWWEDSKHTICSHCADKEIKNSKLTQHRVNDIPDWQLSEEIEEYCYNNCTVCTNECEFSRKKENGNENQNRELLILKTIPKKDDCIDIAGIRGVVVDVVQNKTEFEERFTLEQREDQCKTNGDYIRLFETLTSDEKEFLTAVGLGTFMAQKTLKEFYASLKERVSAYKGQ